MSGDDDNDQQISPVTQEYSNGTHTPVTGGSKPLLKATTYSFKSGDMVRVEMKETLVTDALEIRFRFRTNTPQGAIFSTWARDTDHSIIVAINEDAKLVVGVSMDGNLRSYTIEDPKVTDMQWHDFIFLAEPNKSLFWIDHENVIKFQTQSKPGVATMAIDVIELGTPKTNTIALTYGKFEGQIQELLINNNRYLDIITMPTFAQFVEATAKKVEENVEITNSVSFRAASACVAVNSLPVSSGELRISFRFKTLYDTGLILYRSVSGGGDFIAIELTGSGQLRVVFNSIQGQNHDAKYIDSPPFKPLNDYRWHSVSFQRIKESDYLFINNLYVDGSPITVTTGQPGTLELTGPLYVGGIYREVYHLLDSRVQSLDGFVGCLDSLQYNNQPIDLLAADKIVNPEVIFTGCPDSPKPTFCSINPCHNGGKCLENNNGSYCDCGMTTYSGDTCKMESTTYTFNRGFIKYTFAPQTTPRSKMASLHPRSLTSPAKDSVALAFRTSQSYATLFTVHSRSTDEFLNITLNNGKPIVFYRVGREIHRVENKNHYKGFNDNRRHVLQFERFGPNSTLRVDTEAPWIYVAKYDNLSIFDDQHVILIGGDRPKQMLTEEASLIDTWGTDFTGDIMGVYFNKMKLLDAAAYGLKQIQFSGKVTVRQETIPQIRYDRPLYNDIGAFFFGSSPYSSNDILRPVEKSLCLDHFSYDQQLCPPEMYPYPGNNEILTLEEPKPKPDKGKDPFGGGYGGGDSSYGGGGNNGGGGYGGRDKQEITTLNDDGNPNTNYIDSSFQNNVVEPKNPKDALSLRMSTTISGIIIGIVASIVIAILILIFAVYKYKNRTDLSQQVMRVDTIKLDTLNNCDPRSMAAGAAGAPYNLGPPGKSIMKNGGGSTINTLTRASIDHLNDSKEWYV